MKIGIVTAQESEARPFLENRNYTKTQCGSFAVYKTAVGGREVFLCYPAYVGEICAAAAVQLLITGFGAEVILNFGVVGALTHKTSLFSALLVGSVVHYDMDTSAADDCQPGRYLCFDDTAIECDKTLLDKARKLSDLPVARCASADKFVEGREAKTRLHELYGADICDMESAGILITCKMNGVPCLMVKSVSDSLTDGAAEYETNLNAAVDAFFLFAEKLIALL